MTKKFCDVCQPWNLRPSVGSFLHEQKGLVDLCSTHTGYILHDMLTKKASFETIFDDYFFWKDDHTCA